MRRGLVQGLADGASPKRVEAAYQSSSSSASSDSSDPRSFGSPFVTVHSSPNSASLTLPSLPFHPPNLDGYREGSSDSGVGVTWRDKNGLTVITDGRRATVGGFGEGKAASLLAEEEDLLERGLAAATRLSNFLHTRLATLRTRAKLLGKTHVQMVRSYSNRGKPGL